MKLINEDTISREVAIEQIVNTPALNQDKGQEFLEGSATRQNEIIDILKALPSVAPSRPKGRWLEETYIDGHTHCTCSECLHVRIPDNFCPNCGADMKGADDE